MHFQVRVPKISGDVVALCSVVDAMAKATAFGATEFHQAAYDGLVVNISASLLIEAKKGCLQVCDQNGFAASADELIERVKRTGMYIVASQYVVEPNWQALQKAHPERETAPGCWNWSGIDLGESKFDDVASELRCLCATLKHLNDWGVSEGNSFSLDPNAPPWIDERGVMGLTESPAADAEITTTQKVDADETADGGHEWQTKCRKIADELHARDIAVGAWSSVSDIADRVAPIANERAIRGPNGKLTARNILREALQGDRWNKRRNR